MFQFQYGAIKGYFMCIAFFTFPSFNSNMVRLRVANSYNTTNNNNTQNNTIINNTFILSKYKKEDILDQGIDVRSIYNHETDVYMTMHACMQKLVQKKLVTIPKMILKRAEETLFKIHEDCKWNSICVMNNLKDNAKILAESQSPLISV